MVQLVELSLADGRIRWLLVKIFRLVLEKISILILFISSKTKVTVKAPIPSSEEVVEISGGVTSKELVLLENNGLQGHD